MINLINYTLANPTQISTHPFDCPALNIESYKFPLGCRYKFFCDGDFPSLLFP